MSNTLLLSPLTGAAAGGGGGGGSRTLLTTVDASTASTLEFTSSIDSTYDTYEFVVEDLILDGNVTNSTIHVRVSHDGGCTWISGASDYYTLYTFGGSQSARTGEAGSAIVGVPASAGQDSNDEMAVHGIVRLHVPSSTAHKTQISFNTIFNAGGADRPVDIHGVTNYDSSTTGTPLTAVNAIQFIETGGDTFTGRVAMYGVTTSAS